VIATNAGGLPEIMINGQNGYMSDVGDIVSMSQNAITILENEETMKRFREGAIKQANAFDIHNIIPVYEKLYDEVLQQELVP
jgi:glycosyltransferase involved in cell wall biosynthesis